MKKVVILLLAVATLVASGCSAAYQSMREPNVKIELYSGDYALSDAVVGEATVTRILGIDWERLFSSKVATTNASVIGNVITGSEAFAIYDLMEKNPGYDFVMYPQVIKKTTGIPYLYSKTDITVIARLGKLKKK